MLTGTDRREIESFFERNLDGIVQEQTFERFRFTMEERQYILASLTNSCLDYSNGEKFWSVRDWRDIQVMWLQKQLRPLTAMENRLLGDQVLFFTGLVRGTEKVSPFIVARTESQQNFSDRYHAALYNTGWCCRVGQNFYRSAAESSLSFGDSKLLDLLAKHFSVWVTALSRIRQQDLLDRFSIGS
jgi:hypothetical protein